VKENFRKVHFMERITGDFLNRHYTLGAMQARYREDGEWYHPLTQFPGALFDGGGYLKFANPSEYLENDHLQHGPDPNHIHVPGGISKVPGYVPLSPPPRSLKSD
jgi:5-methylcytosine-specific restriction enzyme A